jgi:hypothetical protein
MGVVLYAGSSFIQVNTVYCCIIFHFNELEMCFNEINICVCLWENRGTKIYPKLKLGISSLKVGGYDFLHPCDGPWNSHLFLKQPSLGIKSDMPGLQS